MRASQGRSELDGLTGFFMSILRFRQQRIAVRRGLFRTCIIESKAVLNNFDELGLALLFLFRRSFVRSVVCSNRARGRGCPQERWCVRGISAVNIGCAALRHSTYNMIYSQDQSTKSIAVNLRDLRCVWLTNSKVTTKRETDAQPCRLTEFPTPAFSLNIT